MARLALTFSRWTTSIHLVWYRHLESFLLPCTSAYKLPLLRVCILHAGTPGYRIARCLKARCFWQSPARSKVVLRSSTATLDTNSQVVPLELVIHKRWQLVRITLVFVVCVFRYCLIHDSCPLWWIEVQSGGAGTSGLTFVDETEAHSAYIANMFSFALSQSSFALCFLSQKIARASVVPCWPFVTSGLASAGSCKLHWHTLPCLTMCLFSTIGRAEFVSG